jgi:hypothetical protein
MSPSEFDLRAALHDGEGDPVNPESVIAAGRAQASRRRNQWRTGAAAAVLVAGLVGVGAVVLGGGSDSASNSGGGRAYSADAAGGAARAPAAQSAAASRSRAAAAAAKPSAANPASEGAKAADIMPCPATAPAAPSPGSGAPSAQMFAKPVADLLICSYESGVGAKPHSVTLRGAQARQLAASLEAASTTRPTGLCPAYVRADQRTVRIVPRSTDGTSLAAVIATLNAPPCRVIVSNGSAVRYGWTPPVTVRPALRQLLTDGPAAPKQGSPIHS